MHNNPLLGSHVNYRCWNSTVKNHRVPKISFFQSTTRGNFDISECKKYLNILMKNIKVRIYISLAVFRLKRKWYGFTIPKKIFTHRYNKLHLLSVRSSLFLERSQWFRKISWKLIGCSRCRNQSGSSKLEIGSRAWIDWLRKWKDLDFRRSNENSKGCWTPLKWGEKAFSVQDFTILWTDREAFPSWLKISSPLTSIANRSYQNGEFRESFANFEPENVVVKYILISAFHVSLAK